MSIDEQLSHYLAGFSFGADPCFAERAEAHDEAFERGCQAGRAAYLAAEQAERERLSGTCPVCHGAGHDAGDGAYCDACRGTGSAPSTRERLDAPARCAMCGGSREVLIQGVGMIQKKPCPACHGTGRRAP